MLGGLAAALPKRQEASSEEDWDEDTAESPKKATAKATQPSIFGADSDLDEADGDIFGEGQCSSQSGGGCDVE